MPKLEYTIVLTAQDNGSVLVERLCHGVLVDRYVTHDLRLSRKNRPWMQVIDEAANTPLGVTVPPIDQSHWDIRRQYVVEERG